MTDLGELFAAQRQLMAALGVECDRSQPNWLPHLHSAAVGIVVEGAEVVDELNTVTRPWARKPVEQVEEALIEESIDVFLYLIELWEILGIGPETVAIQFGAKVGKNLARIQNGHK